MNAPVRGAWPDEAAMLQALGVKTEPGAVPMEDFKEVTAPAAKDEKMTRERVLA